MILRKKYAVKNKQTGGYNPCEIYNGSIMKKIIDNLQKLEIPPSLPHDKDTIQYIDLVNKVFFDCYEILLEHYNDESLYNQFIIRNGQENYISDKFIKILHINYTSLLMMSFLVEFHMFILLYKGIYYENEDIFKNPYNFNTQSELNNNKFKNNWEHYIFDTEIPADHNKNYRDELTYNHKNNTNIVSTFNNFCGELNYTIDIFMEKLIEELLININSLYFQTRIINREITKDELSKLLFFDNKQHCYENWREQIMEYLNKIKNPANNNNIFYNTVYKKIMKAIENSLKIFSDSPQFTYTTDGLGMFTWMYSYTSLQKNIDICSNPATKIILERLQKKYAGVRRVGCCITQSILEQYCLALLHFKENSINLSLSNQGEIVRGKYQGRLHRYWININNALKKHFSLKKNIIDYKKSEYTGVSHWFTTIINDLRYFDGEIIIHGNINIRDIRGFEFRHFAPLSIKNNKWIYFKALIYLSIDLISSFVIINTKNNVPYFFGEQESRFLINNYNDIYSYFEKKTIFYENKYKISPIITIKQNSTKPYTFDIDSLINMVIGTPDINKFVLSDYSNIKPYLNNIEYSKISFDKSSSPNTNKEIFQNILTLFVTNYFYKSTETIYHFFDLINTIFKKAINKYIKKKNLPHDSVQFIFKGGNIFKIIAITNLDKLPFYSRKSLLKIYNKFFKKSDSDFQINIKDLSKLTPPNKTIIEMQEIHEEIENMTFLLLNRIRNFLLENIYKFNDFYKLNSEQQIIIFKNIIDNINKIHKSVLKSPFNNPEIKFNNLFFNEIHITENSKLLEIPFNEINLKDNYGIQQNGRKDFVITISDEVDKFDLLTIPQIQKLQGKDINLGMFDIIQNNNVYKYIDNSSYYISFNKIIPHFTLVRIKVNFKINYNLNDVLYYTNLSAEYIDVSIPKLNYTDKYFNEGYIYEYKTYFFTNDNIRKEFKFLSLSNDAIINDLEFILFINNDYPWSDTKYNSRINRLFLFYAFDLHNKNIIYNNKIDILKIILNLSKYTIDKLSPYLLLDELPDEYLDLITELNNEFIKIFCKLDKSIKFTNLLKSFIIQDNQNSIFKKIIDNENKLSNIKIMHDFFSKVYLIIKNNIIKSFQLQNNYIRKNISINYDNNIAPINIYSKKYIKYKNKYFNLKNNNPILNTKIDTADDENSDNSYDVENSDDDEDTENDDDVENLTDEYIDNDFIYNKDIENFKF